MLCNPHALSRSQLAASLASGLLLLTSGCATLDNPAPEPAESEKAFLTDPLRAAIDRSAPEAESERAAFYRDVLTAELAAARGQHAAAAEAFLAAAQRRNEQGLARRGIREALAAGRNDLALELARLWQATGEPGAEQHGLLLRLAVAAGNAEEARTHLDRYIQAREDKGAALRDVARTLADLDTEQALALELLRDAVDRYAETRDVRAQGNYALGLLAYGFEDDARAAEAAAEAFALSERGALRDRMLLLEAGALLREGRVSEATARVDAAVDEVDEPVALRRNFVELLRQSGERTAARQQVEKLLAAAPDDSDARLTLGELAAQSGDMDTARTALQRVWDSADGERGQAALQLGRISAQAGEIEPARRWFERAADNGEALRAELELARLDAETGDVDAARQRLQQLRDDKPEMAPRLMRAEGEILYRARRYDEAVSLLESGVAAYPRDTELRYAYALALEQSGDLAAAETQLRQLITENPDNAAAYNALGYMLTISNQRLAEAEELIRKALSLRPGDPAILDSLGWVRFKRGDAEAALEHLRAAFSAYPDAEVGAHLGEVLWSLDRRDEARAVWEKARTADADHPVLRETLDRLQVR